MCACTVVLVSGLIVPQWACAATHKEPADSDTPAAGICSDPPIGQVATFTFGLDTPHPRCGKVLPRQRLRLVNDRPETTTFSFLGERFRLVPGSSITLSPLLGDIWEPGVHRLGLSNGPEIWLVGAGPDTSVAPPATDGGAFEPIMCGPGPHLPADAFSRLSGEWNWRDPDEVLLVGRALTVVRPSDHRRWTVRWT